MGILVGIQTLRRDLNHEVYEAEVYIALLVLGLSFQELRFCRPSGSAKTSQML